MLNKVSKYLSLGLVSLTLLVGMQHVVQARQIGSTTANNSGGSTPDGFCVGGTSGIANELCQDRSGNWIPTTTDNQTLGTSALEYNNTYTKSLTVSAGQTTGSAGVTPIANTGGTAATQFVNSGLQVLAPTNVFGLVASSFVPVNSSLILVGANATTVTLTSQPQISTTTVIGGSTLLPFGLFITVTSTATGQNIVFTSSTSSNATGLILGAATRTINKNKSLTLWLDNVTSPAVWREIAFGNN